MLFRAEGPRVAVVGSSGRVQLRPISIGRDYGATLEILGGVSPTDRVVINPADSLEDGQQVNVVQRRPSPDQQHQDNPRVSPNHPNKAAAKDGRTVMRGTALSSSIAVRCLRCGMHRRSALQPPRGSSTSARCVEDAAALGAGRTQGCNSQRRVVAGFSRSHSRCLRTAIAPS